MEEQLKTVIECSKKITEILKANKNCYGIHHPSNCLCCIYTEDCLATMDFYGYVNKFEEDKKLCGK